MPNPVVNAMETTMHAAATQPEVTAKDAPAADSDPLPCSNNPVKPDRGDWEFLYRAVAGMRVRPTTLPSLIEASDSPARSSAPKT